MVLHQFERGLERLVEGAFAKTFRSNLEPVEIGRRLVREMEAGRKLGVRGTVVPNHLIVYLSPEDAEQFESFNAALVHELAEAARTHARSESYMFLGPVIVELIPDESLKRGSLDIEALIAGNEGGRIGSLLMPDGQRLELGEQVVTVGRMPESNLSLSDTKVSRNHAEIRPDAEGYRVIDLSSTNGTLVNGVAIHDKLLSNGDEISFGNTKIRFETS